MGMQSFVKSFDDKYHPAAQQYRNSEGYALPTQRYFAEDARRHGVYPEEAQRKQVEEHWLRELKVRPDEHRRAAKVRQYASDWWAVQAVFAHEKAPAYGDNQVRVEHAYNTNSIQTIFPFYFDLEIVAGILADPVLDRLLARSVPVPSHNASHIEMNQTAGDSSFGEAGEGTTFVQLIVKETERTVKLLKWAGELLASYEALRLQRIDVLSEALRQIGILYAQLLTDRALFRLIEGDGAGAGAITDVPTAVAGTPVYADLINLEADFTMGYKPDTILTPKTPWVKLLNMPVYTDPLAGVLHQTTGAQPTPLGMDLVRWDVTGRVTTWANTNILMFDSNRALIQYTEGGLLTESENIIRSQWHRLVISQWTDFAVRDRAAARRGTGY